VEQRKNSFSASTFTQGRVPKQEITPLYKELINKKADL